MIAYLITKVGYMVLYNNLFYLITLKGKKAKGTYLERFNKTFGYSLIFSGLITGLLVIVKKYSPEHYLQGYGLFIAIIIVFLLVKFYSYRNEEKELLNNG